MIMYGKALHRFNEGILMLYYFYVKTINTIVDLTLIEIEI